MGGGGVIAKKWALDRRVAESENQLGHSPRPSSSHRCIDFVLNVHTCLSVADVPQMLGLQWNTIESRTTELKMFAVYTYVY
jgi:hypothetical protein